MPTPSSGLTPEQIQATWLAVGAPTNFQFDAPVQSAAPLPINMNPVPFPALPTQAEALAEAQRQQDLITAWLAQTAPAREANQATYQRALDDFMRRSLAGRQDPAGLAALAALGP